MAFSFINSENAFIQVNILQAFVESFGGPEIRLLLLKRSLKCWAVIASM